MKKAKPTRVTGNDLREYDLTRAVRGKYAAKASRVTRFLRVLEPDLAKHFPDSRSVNEALRGLLKIEAALPRRRSRGRRAA